MSEQVQAVPRSGIAPSAEAAVGRVVESLARLLALAGGLVLGGLAVMSVVSITGRAFSHIGLGPVPGDFEIMEAGGAAAVFAFLPWCQLRGGHVTVDLLADYVPARFWAACAIMGNIAMSIAAVIIAWQLWLGFLDKYAYGETSMILQMPIWWGYAAGVVGACLFAVVCLFTVWRSLNDAMTDARGEGSTHL